MTNLGMYKSLVNKFLLITILLSISSSAFAWLSIYDLLEKESDNVLPISKISDWKPMVKDLFSKNLELIKNNEIKITNQTLEKIVDFYSNNNCYLKKSDILNIVINSNNWALYTLESTLIDKSSQKPWTWSASDILKSYKKILDCKKIPLQKNNYKDLQNIENEVNWLYSTIIDNEYKIETKNQDNFWEDLFRNGDDKDSSFDILKDIYNIWYILTQNFNEQVKLYFYDMPNKESNKDWTLSFNNIIWKKLAASTGDINDLSIDKISNAEINNFISQVNQTQNSNSTSYESNQCVDTTPSTTSTDNIINEKVDYQTVLDSVQNFISNSNIDSKINEILTDKFKQDMKTESKSWSWADKQDQNNKIEKIVDKGMTINKSCSDNCSTKPSIWEQEKCELDCSLSCFEKCDDIKNNTEKVICKSECVCFLVSGPEDPMVNWLIEADIYKIKFCKTPVTNQKVQRNKVVGSVEDIFYEMINVFKNLRDWWEMIKHTQTKEFLEIPVKLNFGKIFSFALNINRRKIPNTKQTKAIETEKIESNKKQNSYIKDSKTNDNEKDNYNKYIIVQSIASTNTNTQDIVDVNQRIKQLDEQKAILEKTKLKSEDTIKNSQNEKTISMTILLENFLLENISFRKEFWTTISDSNDIAYSLKEKINGSE